MFYLYISIFYTMISYKLIIFMMYMYILYNRTNYIYDVFCHTFFLFLYLVSDFPFFFNILIISLLGYPESFSLVSLFHYT